MALVAPLADTMQMRLVLRDQKSKFSIYGNGDFELPLMKGTSLRFNAKVKASCITLGKESWALLHIIKDLHVLLLYSVMGGVVSLAIVDAGGVDDGSLAGLSSKDVIGKLAKYIKATFERDRFKSEWRRTDEIDDPMDRGPDKLPEEGHRNPAA